MKGSERIELRQARNHGKKPALAAFARQSVAVLQVAGLMGVLPIYSSLEVAT
jgi:hypothetical protein